MGDIGTSNDSESVAICRDIRPLLRTKSNDFSKVCYSIWALWKRCDLGLSMFSGAMPINHSSAGTGSHMLQLLFKRFSPQSR